MSTVVEIRPVERRAPGRPPAPSVRMGPLRAFGACGVAFALLSAVAWIAAQLLPTAPASVAAVPGALPVGVRDLLALRYLLLIPFAIGLHRILPRTPGGVAGPLLLALAGMIGAAGIPALPTKVMAPALAALAGRLSNNDVWREPSAYTGATAAVAVATAVIAVLLGNGEGSWTDWVSTVVAGQWALVMGVVLVRVGALASAPRRSFTA